MSDNFDYIIVGSGINSLVCASLLGKKGHKVLLLERNAEIGGCIRSEAITESGFIHDVMATTFVLFITSPAYAALADDLGRHGLEFCHAEFPSGVLRPSQEAAIVTMDRSKNQQHFDEISQGAGAQHVQDVQMIEQNADLIFSLLGAQLWTVKTAKLLAKYAWKNSLNHLSQFIGEAMRPARAWLENFYPHPTMQALWAPWVLHVGLSPESSYSSQMAKVIAFALEAAGAPIVKGGASNLLTAFTSLIKENSGEIITDADVQKINLNQSGQAKSVSTANKTFYANKGVICSTTPEQLYHHLLKDADVTKHPHMARNQTASQHYRHGKGNFQMHYALSALPEWHSKGVSGQQMQKIALLHLTDGIDAVSKATNEAERGHLPVTPTICVGQPHALDASRCPDGTAILWLQLPEAPRYIKGDAAGIITAPKDGQWDEKIREQYADRVEEILKQHIKNFDAIKLSRRAYSPADLQQLNGNLVGGDPYGGSCALDQFFIWRPFSHSKNHQTPVKNLYHIGASTHPGPGLGGGSGFLVANQLK